MTAMSTSGFRRVGAAGIAFAVVAGTAVLGAAPAEAAGLSWNCKILSSTIPWNGQVQGSLSPAKPKAGATVSMVVSFPGGYKTGPVPVPANKLQPVLYLNVNGQAVTARGGKNPSALGPNVTFPVPTTTVSFKAKAGSNKVTLTKVVFDYLPGEPDTTCQGNVPTVVSFTAAGASTATPTPTPTPTATASQTADPTATATATAASSPNTGGLPRTGPEDATRTLLIALAALQLGLIAAVRWGRRTSTSGAHR